MSTSLALAGVIGQAGCVTLLLILVSLAVGLWLDARFDTRPMFTLLLVLGSIPITMYLMARIALGSAGRVQPPATGAPPRTEEEPGAEDP